jgi:hypothetical protein
VFIRIGKAQWKAKSMCGDCSEFFPKMSNLDTVDIGILVGLLALSAGYLFWKKNTQQPVPQKKMTLAELKSI